MFAFALALLLQSAPLPDIRVEKTADGGYLMTVGTFAIADADAVNAQLDVIVKQKCGALTPRWGKYTMERVPAGTRGMTADSFVNYRQAFSCVDPATDPHQPAPANWKASPADDADARAFTLRYLAAMDRSDSEAVRAMYIPTLVASTPAEELRATVNKFHGISDPRSRQVTAVHWWINPDFGPFPGLFVAVSFNGPQHCGVLLLYRSGPGKYALTRQEVFGKPLAYKLTADERVALDRICEQL